MLFLQIKINRMKRKVLQAIANMFIKVLENVNDPFMFEYYFNMAVWFNSYCVVMHDIYLN